MSSIFSKSTESISNFLINISSPKNIILLGLGYLFLSHYNKVTPKKDEPKIESTWIPFFGHALKMGKDPIGLMMQLAKNAYERSNEYIFGMVLLGNRVFIITDPHSAEVVIRHSKDLTHIEFQNDILINFFNCNKEIIVNQILDESLHRKFYSHFLFSDNSLSELTSRMLFQLNEQFSEVQDGVYDLQDFLNHFIFNASICSILGSDILAIDVPATPPQSDKSACPFASVSSNKKVPFEKKDKIARSLFDSFVAFDKSLPLAATGFSVNIINSAKKGRDHLASASYYASKRFTERWGDKPVEKSDKVYLEGYQKEASNDNQVQSRFMEVRSSYFRRCLPLGEKDMNRKDYDQIKNIKKFQEPLKPYEIGEMQTALLWASVGNTMPASFWCLFYLLKFPKKYERLESEILSNSEHSKVIKAIMSGQEITSELFDLFEQEHFNDLHYMDACISETLRLSSGSLIMRVVTNDNGLEIKMSDGKIYKLRKNDRLGLAPPLFHYDEDLYPNPYSFNPERWIPSDDELRNEIEQNARENNETLTDEKLEEGIKEKKRLAANGKIKMFKNGKEVPSSRGFLPFGAGTAYCPGRRFARNEIKLILIFLILKFDISFNENYPVIDGEVQCPLPRVDGGRAGIGIFPSIDIIPIKLSKKNN